jgi:hypothetical protein
MLGLDFVSDGVTVQQQCGHDLGKDMPSSDFYLQSGVTGTIKKPLVESNEPVVFIVALKSGVSTLPAVHVHS